MNVNAHVVVQINRAWPAAPSATRSRRPKSELRPFDIMPEDSNMGDGETLTRFLTWAAETFHAENYCLVLWGHAFGLGFGRDHNDGLTLTRVARCARAFSREDHPKTRNWISLGDERLRDELREAGLRSSEGASLHGRLADRRSVSPAGPIERFSA